jgi:hypothetical protein
VVRACRGGCGGGCKVRRPIRLALDPLSHSLASPPAPYHSPGTGQSREPKGRRRLPMSRLATSSKDSPGKTYNTIILVLAQQHTLHPPSQDLLPQPRERFGRVGLGGVAKVRSFGRVDA